MSAGFYAGDISAAEAWDILKEQPGAVLVDVRTRAEWSFVGVADLASLGKEAVLIEWQSYPQMSVNDAFVGTLDKALGAKGVGRDQPVLFLCRSGARSQSAAMAATAAGYSAAFNVAGGFEGPHGPDGHRGTVDGWKAAGLPWRQS